MAQEPSQEEKDEVEWKNPANWRFGIFYFGEKDSRIWVPKRTIFTRKRSGGTPNLAKKAARQYLMLLLGGFLAILLLISLLRRLGILGG